MVKKLKLKEKFRKMLEKLVRKKLKKSLEKILCWYKIVIYRYNKIPPREAEKSSKGKKLRKEFEKN